jgi:hypothetical protein
MVQVAKGIPYPHVGRDPAVGMVVFVRRFTSMAASAASNILTAR